ncbi:MAG: VPLPA-CTERM sorting domain-containing protein [Pseudomonadota bacterium]
MLLGKITKLTSAAVVGLGLMCGAASAATVIDLTGSGGNLGPSERYVEDGITLTVTSFGGTIHQNGNGLGVRRGVDRNRLGSNGTTNESLTFSFSQPIGLLGSVVFEHRGGTERFDILDATSTILGSFAISGPGGSSLVTLSDLDLLGSEFTFRHTSGSGIRINELTLTAVPLPAALPMLLGAFGGLVLLGRRRPAA